RPERIEANAAWCEHRLPAELTFDRHHRMAGKAAVDVDGRDDFEEVLLVGVSAPPLPRWVSKIRMHRYSFAVQPLRVDRDRGVRRSQRMDDVEPSCRQDRTERAEECARRPSLLCGTAQQTDDTNPIFGPHARVAGAGDDRHVMPATRKRRRELMHVTLTATSNERPRE